ncbi:hypothetical protein PROVRETT_06794 [Providencia rettgeri DSM 1131]|nr:hypothetical protein PROVRETT_06794 [Providencia rettgeri DSM 1131]
MITFCYFFLFSMVLVKGKNNIFILYQCVNYWLFFALARSNKSEN